MEDMQEKGWKKIEFPWLFSESGTQMSQQTECDPTFMKLQYPIPY